MTDPLLALVVEVAERVQAPRDAVFAALTDVEAVAGLGPEHDAARWDGPERGLGATFTGSNRAGETAWQVPCTVVLSDPPAAFGWVVGDPASPTTTWTYALLEDGTGTLVRQRVAHGPGWSFLRQACERRPDEAEALVARRRAGLEVNMRTVLRAVAARLEQAGSQS